MVLTVHDVLERVVSPEEVSEHIEGVPEHKVWESVDGFGPLEASVELSLVSAASAATAVGGAVGPTVLVGRVQPLVSVLVVSPPLLICDEKVKFGKHGKITCTAGRFDHLAPKKLIDELKAFSAVSKYMYVKL